jgi:predicted porin
MKKSLLALAVLGAFAGVASAQSSVTIYGVVDLGVIKSNGGSATNPGFTNTKAYQLAQARASRLGFRGNEDLGGGLSAQFQIEHRFNPDTGAASSGSHFWQGRSYVQLTSAAAGRVYLGREYTPTFFIANKSDPFGWDGVGQMGQAYQYAGYGTPDTIDGSAAETGVRTSNTVGYETPSFGGFTVNAAVSLSEATQKGRDMAGSFVYAAGPIYAALGLERVYKGAMQKQGLMNAAFHYDLGVVKLMAYYARSKTATPTTLTDVRTIPALGVGRDRNNAFTLGALAPIGQGVLKVAYGRTDPARSNNLRQKGAVGYDYLLSKRTTIYADASAAKEDQRTNNKALSVGIRHVF